MKKLILGVLMSICSILPAQAITLPNAQAGAYYSFKDHAINAMTTIEVIKIKNLVALELGAAGDTNESDWKGIAALSLDIKQLSLGNYIKLPILDLIAFRPAVIVGLGHINGKDLAGAKFDWGLGATIIQTKW